MKYKAISKKTNDDLTLGEKLSPVLIEIEECLWDFEANVGTQPCFATEGFRAACKIFMSALMDKLFEKQMAEKRTMKVACEEAQFYGEEIHKLVKRATGIDTKELYKQ